jgi:hypothetical protein
MQETKPADVAAFRKWSTTATCGDLGHTAEKWYGITQGNVVTQILDSPFFSALPTFLGEASKDYSSEQAGAALVSLGRELDPGKFWSRKSASSLFDKLFRLNIVENTGFPDAPPGGWVSLRDAFRFGAVDDMVRTTLVVAYADGPSFLARWLADKAREEGLTSVIKDHAKEKGYYAKHLYVGLSVDVQDPEGGFGKLTIPVEIQITTELQGVLKEITHLLYEQERVTGPLEADWKESFESGRFRAAYMAHSLRFIEAMIVELRNRVLGRDGK